MTHFYERNIVDIKNEYSTYLIDMLVPLIYEGIQSTYNHAMDYCNKMDQMNTEHVGVVNIFRAFLKDIPKLSATAIEAETRRIKEFSLCSDWFDDLVKAVIKSYIVLLTFNVSGQTCKLVNEKYHEKINVNEFVHKCYIECATTFFNNPELFWDGHSDEIRQSCKAVAYKHIRQGITDAIHKMLPIKLILQEFLNNDYIITPHEKHSKKTQNSFGILEHSSSSSNSYGNGMLVQSSHYDNSNSRINKFNNVIIDQHDNVENIKNEIEKSITPPIDVEQHTDEKQNQQPENIIHNNENETQIINNKLSENIIHDAENDQQYENIIHNNENELQHMNNKQYDHNVLPIKQDEYVPNPQDIDKYFGNYFAPL